MATKVLTSSQLTFVDLTDQRKLSIYLTSNLQTIQMRTTSGANYIYDPDWSTSNLTISLQAFLDQEQIDDVDRNANTNMSIKWWYKDGNKDPVEIVGETGRELTVSTNALGSTTHKMLTYICEVTYQDPGTKITSTVKSQLTYTLLDTAKDGENAKTCSISGGQVFKKDINGNVSPSIIELTAILNNVELYKTTNCAWQYYDFEESVYKNYPSDPSINPDLISPTLKVKYDNDTIFFNDVARIRMLADTNGSMYDVITITHISDGAKGETGSSGYTILLTNESHTFSGTVDSAKNESITTEIMVYQGSQTKDFNIVSIDGIAPSTSVQNTKTAGLTFSVNGKIITFISSESLTEQSGSIPIVIKVDGISYTKYFSWSVARTGTGACTVRIEASSQIFKSTDGVSYLPETITLTPTVQNLSLADARWQYSTPAFTGWTNIGNTSVSSSNFYYDANTKVLTIPSGCMSYNNEITSIVFRCIVGTYTDSVTVARLTDGKSAAAAYTVILSNEMQNIATNSSLVPLSAETFPCNVVVYEGTTQLTATNGVVGDGTFKVILPETFPNGITLTQETPGDIKFAVSSSSAIAASGSIDIMIQIESEDNVVTKSISFAASIAGTDGTSPVVLQIFAPDGTVFANQSGAKRLKTVAYEGSKKIESDATYQWAAYNPTNPEDFNGDGYKDIEDGTGTGSEYIVYGEDVVNIQTYRCTMTYKGTDYAAVITLEDKSDPYVSEMLTVGGTTFKNGQGGSAVYVIVRSGGKEVDQFKRGNHLPSVNPPGVAQEGDLWWKVYSGGIMLMEYGGSSWVAVPDGEYSDIQDLSYVWTLMREDGSYDEDFGKEHVGKIIYLSCADIKNIGTLQCDVTAGEAASSNRSGALHINDESYAANDDENGNVEIESGTVTDDGEGNVTIS